MSKDIWMCLGIWETSIPKEEGLNANIEVETCLACSRVSDKAVWLK